MRSVTDHSENLVCANDNKLNARHNLSATTHTTLSTVAPITLGNRFHGLSVDEDIMLEHSVQNIFLSSPSNVPKRRTLAHMNW